MTGLGIIRAVACRDVRQCGGRRFSPDNNRRGQDKSDGPTGAYAVVVAEFFRTSRPTRGATGRPKRLAFFDFLGTMPILAIC